jgi:hypothetical protein
MATSDPGRRTRIRKSRPAILLVAGGIVAALIATTAALTSGSGGNAAAKSGSTAAAPAARTVPAAFGWLRARGAPSGWRQASLPGGGAVLSYPPSLHPAGGDRGTVSAELTTTSGEVAAYLNVTPRQGGETLANWATFRLGHLREDDARSARLDSAATGLRFRGGTGSCVIDDYVTTMGANHYREIACYVQGAHHASVLIAAAPAADWGTYAGPLEQAVSAFRVT